MVTTAVERTARASRAHRVAWGVIVIADAGMLLWGAMAAVAPDHLLGPAGLPILAAGYEGFTGRSWAELAKPTSDYMTLLFRMYGIFIVAFSILAIVIAATALRRGDRWAWWTLLVGNTIAFVSAMTYDQIVRAVGPFEITEYLGLAAIYGALALIAPFPARWRSRSPPRASAFPTHHG